MLETCENLLDDFARCHHCISREHVCSRKYSLQTLDQSSAGAALCSYIVPVNSPPMNVHDPLPAARRRCEYATFRVQPMHMNPLETYLRDLHDIHSTRAAVPETSYFSGMEWLLNEIDKPVVETMVA
jgi:hypothetical protein